MAPYTRNLGESTRGTMFDEISPLLPPPGFGMKTFDILEPDNISRSKSRKSRPTPRVSIKFASKDSVDERKHHPIRNSVFFLKNISKKGFLIR